MFQNINMLFLLLKTFKHFLVIYQSWRRSGNQENCTDQERGLKLLELLWRSADGNIYAIQSVLNFLGRVLSPGFSGILPSCFRGYFVGHKFFLVGISWVPIFFSWVFRSSQFFSRGYFVRPNFFLVGISWVQNLFSWVILFSVVDRMRKSSIEIYLKLRILFHIDFNNSEFCLY